MQFSDEKITSLIIEKIKAISFKKISSLQEELIESGTLTSVSLVELAVSLEKEFLVSIPFLEINKQNFKTVEAIKNLIQKLIQ